MLELIREYFREWSITEPIDGCGILASISGSSLGFYLAEVAGGTLGCVQVRPLPGIPAATECKRLFVRPAARGTGLGKRLLRHAEQQAAVAGFTWMYLDTRADFHTAISLYLATGYGACERYNLNPQAELFFRKHLA